MDWNEWKLWAIRGQDFHLPSQTPRNACFFLSQLSFHLRQTFKIGEKYHPLGYEIWVSVCLSRGLKDISSQKGKT